MISYWTWRCELFACSRQLIQLLTDALCTHSRNRHHQKPNFKHDVVVDYLAKRITEGKAGMRSGESFYKYPGKEEGSAAEPVLCGGPTGCCTWTCRSTRCGGRR
ncbi:hypothetical protein K437DRAFT_192306 [Tilletiaria anomala UBC 951]|uniref:Uncharacterized protein n=1 Tax=Tilletiaria anomala (strain ATCC 24038 / CBS 436.72 / UBC 951) TaxID=1037660 RepID=A0A066VMU5_TILAU|nr:uncharacterized protein K437DRAFT_192306 [Tilletiaria anomala UBC 951]KDN40099.1 hypothetical protein K437DRAFT_192306 [Tilletiaria anomala UBC 951]